MTCKRFRISVQEVKMKRTKTWMVLVNKALRTWDCVCMHMLICGGAGHARGTSRCWSAANHSKACRRKFRAEGILLMQDRWRIESVKGIRCQENPLTVTKSADPRAGTDREDLRRRLHRSGGTALHEKQTTWVSGLGSHEEVKSFAYLGQ